MILVTFHNISFNDGDAFEEFDDIVLGEFLCVDGY